MGQGMGPVVEFLQVGDAGQGAHQESQDLGLRRMHNAFLRYRHSHDLGNQPDLIGKLAPGNHQGVLRKHALGQFLHPIQTLRHRSASNVQW